MGALPSTPWTQHARAAVQRALQAEPAAVRERVMRALESDFAALAAHELRLQQQGDWLRDRVHHPWS